MAMRDHLAALIDPPPDLVFQALLAQNLMAFTEFAFSAVRPGVSFKPNWHLEAVTEKLSKVASGKIRRLIITLPPRTLKSLCASVALPAWFLGHYPSERVAIGRLDGVVHTGLLVEERYAHAVVGAADNGDFAAKANDAAELLRKC